MPAAKRKAEKAPGKTGRLPKAEKWVRRHSTTACLNIVPLQGFNNIVLFDFVQRVQQRHTDHGKHRQRRRQIIIPAEGIA